MLDIALTMGSAGGAGLVWQGDGGNNDWDIGSSPDWLNGGTAATFANADTVMSRSNEELLAEVFPNVAVTRPVGPHETLLSIDKARRVLGYDPQHSWRDQRGS